MRMLTQMRVVLLRIAAKGPFDMRFVGGQSRLSWRRLLTSRFWGGAVGQGTEKDYRSLAHDEMDEFGIRALCPAL
jgi:hypothetical protein